MVPVLAKNVSTRANIETTTIASSMLRERLALLLKFVVSELLTTTIIVVELLSIFTDTIRARYLIQSIYMSV
jgi:hypothetical protein